MIYRLLGPEALRLQELVKSNRGPFFHRGQDRRSLHMELVAATTSFFPFPL